MKKISFFVLLCLFGNTFAQSIWADDDEDNRIALMQANLSSITSYESESSDTDYMLAPPPHLPEKDEKAEYRYSVYQKNQGPPSSATSSSGSSSSSHVVAEPKKTDLRLHELAATGDFSAGIEFLISEIKNLEIQDDEGNTPLHIACYNKHINLCETLIKHGALVTSLNKKGWTPFHCAALHNDIALIDKLYEKIDNINMQTTISGDTALHIASKCGNVSLCRYLLSRKAKQDLLNQKGNTAFDNAFEHEDIDVAKEFTYGALPEIIKKTIQKKRPHILYKLLNESKNLKKDLITASGESALHIACALEVDEKRELSRGLVVEMKKISPKPLCIYDRKAQKQMLDILLTKCDISIDLLDNYGRTPLHVATEWGQEIACMTLLEKKASVKKTVSHYSMRDKVFTPLTLAAIYNHAPILGLYIDNLIAKNGLDEFVQIYPQLFCYAIDNSSPHVIKLLFFYRKKPELARKQFINIYPLHRSCSVGNLEVCKAVLNEMANPEEIMNLSTVQDKLIADYPCIEEKDGLTPLHCAANGGHALVCDLLLRKKINPDCKTSSGITPLAMACGKNDLEVIKLLLKHKAEITLEALEFAQAEVCQILLKEADVRYNNIPLDERGVSEEEKSVVRLLQKKDSAGKTLLHKAVLQGNLGKCKCLLEWKAELSTDDREGKTALHLACDPGEERTNLRNNGPLQIIKVLLEAKGMSKEIIDHRDNNGNTAFSIACKGGKNALVAATLLLDAGADPNYLSTRSSSRFRLQGESVAPELKSLIDKYMR